MLIGDNYEQTWNRNILEKATGQLERARGAEDQGMRGGPGGHEGRPAPLKVASWGTAQYMS